MRRTVWGRHHPVLRVSRACTSRHSALADGQSKAVANRLRGLVRPIPIEREKPENFVVRQNISHYRDLLATGRMDEKQRRSIERLLMEEEARLSEAAEQQPGPERKTPG